MHYIQMIDKLTFDGSKDVSIKSVPPALGVSEVAVGIH
jgi:hypothetical protein